MPKSDNQKAKLFALYKILHYYTDENNGLSMLEIIAKLEHDYDIVAERRSIISDLATLETVFHIEVEARKSNTTRYHLKTRSFSFSDLEALAHSIQTNDILTEAAARELTNKLKTLCSIHEGKQIQIQSDLSDHICGIDEDILNKINTIELAIKENKQIMFNYPRYDISNPSHVECNIDCYFASPCEIAYANGQYYLFAQENPYFKILNDGGIFYFALKKMKDVRLPYPRKRRGVEEFEEMAVTGFSKAAAFPTYDSKTETVSMKFSNSLLELMKDRFGANVEISTTDEGHSRLAAAAEITPEFFGWLFSLGTGARLLTPLHVVQSYKKWLKDIHEMYQVPAKLSKDS